MNGYKAWPMPRQMKVSMMDCYKRKKGRLVDCRWKIYLSNYCIIHSIFLFWTVQYWRPLPFMYIFFNFYRHY